MLDAVKQNVVEEKKEVAGPYSNKLGGDTVNLPNLSKRRSTTTSRESDVRRGSTIVNMEMLDSI